MKVEEAHKINELFKQIDELTAENTVLKADKGKVVERDSLSKRFDAIEAKLDKLLKKS